MSQILNRVRTIDPNDSDAVKQALSTFFQNIPKHAEVDCNTWLRTLENVLNRFPNYCTPHRATVENYLSHFLCHNNYYNVIEAAKCAHILQKVRPSQDKAATAKACWREQVTVLCNAANSLVDAVFTNSINIYKNSKKSQKKDTPILANCPLTTALSQICKVQKTQDKMQKNSILAIRLRNVLVFLQAMLVEVYPVAKPIRTQIILEVIVQALSASSANTDGVDVSIVKIQALRTLDALVACLGPNLIPFSALVFRFVMQTLRWTSDNPSEESRRVRCAAYNSLSGWLAALRAHRPGGEARGLLWEDELTRHLIDDVTPTQRLVHLTMSTQPTKNLSKKAKKRLANTMLQESTISVHTPGEKNKLTAAEDVNDEVAIAALECAETFLTVCGIFLKPKTHKMFQERIVRECYNVDAYSAERAIRLLRTLESARKSAPSGVPPPTQYCLQLYSELLNSRRRDISTFCSQALLDIRLHLHCSPPSLNFALQVHDEKNKPKDKRKRMSERNRAVLESLLGAERMPSEDIEDVISVTDEPSNKKLRLDEEIAEKISLSSDSVCSVEISDDSEAEESVVKEVEVIIEEVRESNGNNEVNIEPIMEEKTESKTVEVNQETTESVEIEVAIKDQGNMEQKIEDSEPIVEQSKNNEVQEKDIIFDAKTQLPLNISDDTLDNDERPLSMEVGYDYPNTGKEKVTVLENMDDENLPSTNDTDDIQITCGQDVKTPQDNTDKNIDNLEQAEDKNKQCITTENAPTANGVDKPTEEIVENGDVGIETNEVSVKTASKNDGITVEDMLADFVDEVNEESQPVV